MELNLRFPPTPEFASRHADMMVETAKEVSGIALDFSPESLRAVDHIIEQFRQDGVTQEQVAETLFGFGCYVGEVFVRRNSARWRTADGTPMQGLTGFMVVELGSGTLCNPIGKVFKRLTNGEADSLPYFYRVFTRDEQPIAPPAAERPSNPSFWRRLFGGR